MLDPSLLQSKKSPSQYNIPALGSMNAGRKLISLLFPHLTLGKQPPIEYVYLFIKASDAEGKSFIISDEI